jgi:hypothetical protein
VFSLISVQIASKGVCGFQFHSCLAREESKTSHGTSKGLDRFSAPTRRAPNRCSHQALNSRSDALCSVPPPIFKIRAFFGSR